MNHQYYMDEAIKEAKKALSVDEVPIGCVIVFNGEIIARAHNRKEELQQVTAHAEVLAIEQACRFMKSWRLENCTLYVTLEPCPMCAGTIQQARIPVVVFGAKDPKGGSFGSNFNLNEVKGLNHYPMIESGIEEEKCSKLLKNYFKTKRNSKKTETE